MRVVGLGAGGHAQVVLTALAEHEVVGLLDPRTDLHGTEIGGVRVLGGDEHLPDLDVDGAFVGVGGLGLAGVRRRLHRVIEAAGLPVIVCVHPRAIVAPTASLGPGVQVMPGAVINPDAVLGEGSIVNSAAVIEHGCRVGSHAHVAPNATILGEARIGDDALVGAGAVVLPGVEVGHGARVGAGAVVTRDVADRATVFGIPAA